eukprot:6358808-Amphidinium_carterae.1
MQPPMPQPSFKSALKSTRTLLKGLLKPADVAQRVCSSWLATSVLGIRNLRNEATQRPLVSRAALLWVHFWYHTNHMITDTFREQCKSHEGTKYEKTPSIDTHSHGNKNDDDSIVTRMTP